jgi:hypothetical protein
MKKKTDAKARSIILPLGLILLAVALGKPKKVLFDWTLIEIIYKKLKIDYYDTFSGEWIIFGDKND